jgi:DNA-binding NarL/FixJ family response regulator
VCQSTACRTGSAVWAFKYLSERVTTQVYTTLKFSEALVPTDVIRPAEMRVLVVEDFASFRKFIMSTLRERHDLQIVGEASDGLEAVRKAVELNPDLVLMDIGLPSLNGIEAARQILKLVPDAKILFLSQENSAEIIQEALSSQASGYVVKENAGFDLLPAIEAVVSGRQFVSGS